MSVGRLRGAVTLLIPMLIAVKTSVYLLSQFLGFYRIAGVRQAFCKPGQIAARQLPLTGQLESEPNHARLFRTWDHWYG